LDPSAANSFSLLASALLRGFLEVIARLHFAEQTFTLHLFLKSAKSLIDIIIADDDLYDGLFSIKWRG